MINNKNVKINEQKRFLLLAGSEMTKRALAAQIREILGDIVRIDALSIDGGINLFAVRALEPDVIIVSSLEAYDELKDAGVIDSSCSCFVCERTLNLTDIEKVIAIPKGERVLFVNDSMESAESCVQDLLEIGIDHVEYIPWCPGKAGIDFSGITTVVTAGETHLAPKGIGRIIDLGPRVISVLSIIRICELAKSPEGWKNKVLDPYKRKIIQISKEMTVIHGETETLRGILRERLESRGYVAPYTFEHILGTSEAITEARERAARLAETDLTVLLEGESGTGKELFASAIHNRSKRKNGPFLAVNFSALPEELVESELFGYEEGAFTGASKGGKVGLFEKADMGTIFLDEIGDVSPKTQARLLRVLQEKEIMPVGGNTIKKVNIRVVAATNKNLVDMVAAGQFRSDLYYRLKMGYVHVPPVRHRKEDIPILVRHFIEKETMGEGIINVDQSLYDVFSQYDWVGNVREISNTVKYMMAVRANPERLEKGDLPDENYFGKEGYLGKLEKPQKPEVPEELNETSDVLRQIEGDMDIQEVLSLLRAVEVLRQREGSAGRARISAYLIENGVPLSENQVRGRLRILEEYQVVKYLKGRKGVILTRKGRELLEDEKQKSQSDKV